jgi:4,5-DOPA dioxygenase extradiol
MNRKAFIQSLASIPIAGAGIQTLDFLSRSLEKTEKMPVLFLGHGSPMNAIEENIFVRGFRSIAGKLPKPSAILCVSAHWETRGTWVTAMASPRTIHDFGGFPKALYDIRYPVPGSPSLASDIQNMLPNQAIGLDHQWGLDHGAWTVLRHLYPEADIPVIQLSLDVHKSPAQHYELAKALSGLREKGVLIVGSGNMVHNLGKLAWDKMQVDDFAFDWAREASEAMKSHLLAGRHKALIDFRSQGKSFDLAIPTPEHYLPLLYAIALHDREKESLTLFNDKAVAGALTMTSVYIS